MESECHQLDLKLAQLTIGQTGDRVGFLTHSALIHELQDLEEKRERELAHTGMLDEVLTAIAVQLDNSEANPQVRELRQEAVWARQRVEELVRICMQTKQNSTESYPYTSIIQGKEDC